jgi:serine/threonine protein kinase
MAEYYDPKTYPTEWNYLQSGTIVDQYIIERELAHGGFSSVYLARQLEDQILVAIKEFLPRKQAHRTWNNVVVANSEEDRILFNRGRALFFEEAKVLSQLKHHNIVEVINFFQANSTVYMVMTYDYGVSLNNLITDGQLPIDEEFLVQVFTALLNGIEVIHQHNMVHLDIKPGNILIRPDNDPLLLDFGAIQKNSQSGKMSQTLVLTNGFSPIEQYSAKSIGAWTDIYAVGATMRCCLDKQVPQPSPARLKNDTQIPAVKAFKRKFPTYLLEAIDWAMELQPRKRPQNTTEFVEALNAGNSNAKKG